MPLSRLENFLINTDGNILYVNPSDLDATDSFDNRGNSLTRPFVTLQRALIEAARFAYQIGEKNDRFDKTTILLYPGTHLIDNRPGYYIDDAGSGNPVYKEINSSGDPVTVNVPNIELTPSTIFDISNSSNVLYKFNSVNGGVIIPKGTSIVGMDLRKTKIKPLYVPDATDASVDPTAIFRVTGGCYFWQFSIFDADRAVYYKRNYGTKQHQSKSHHKVTVFEYADGVNKETLTQLTDLEMYYFKLMNAYGATVGDVRRIDNYPVNKDFQPNNPEFRIVGLLRDSDLPITTIKAQGSTAEITTQDKHELNVDDPIYIAGVSSSLYNGGFVVSGITSERTFTYNLPSTPNNLVLAPSGNTKVIVETDNVDGASPYIFNISLRSVYGMNGMHADGSKATGFKSMVVAQYTGIGLQKDDNAFVLYDQTTDQYLLQSSITDEGKKPLHTNQDAIYRYSYKNAHVKASNDSVIQAVSVFAIGFAEHFVADRGADQSITNSNSNFGAKSLVSTGFRKDSFARDNNGYITHIVPPQDLETKSFNVLWRVLDPIRTEQIGISSHLYLLQETDIDNPPSHIANGFRVGAKMNEVLSLDVNVGGAITSYSSPILMHVPSGEGPSSKKVFTVNKDTNKLNDITSNEITLTENHNFSAGESVRVFSDNGKLPNGIEHNQKYYVIPQGSGNENKIKLAKSFNTAISGESISISNKFGGKLEIVSYVTDKVPGEPGHPIQYDETNTQWYIIGSASATNTIYSGFVGFSTEIEKSNSVTTFERKSENRELDNRTYRLRYVLPKEFTNAKEPEKNYVLQESSTVGEDKRSQDSLSRLIDNRNPRIIAGITSVQGIPNQNSVVTITSEKPHKLSIGDRVLIRNVASTENPSAVDNEGFNGYYDVTNTPSTKTFTYTSPKSGIGTYINYVSTIRETAGAGTTLPSFARNEYDTTYSIQKIDTVQSYISGQQDGVYYLTCLVGNISPTTNQGFSNLKFKQNASHLYPTVDKDNLDVDPIQSISRASNESLGKVNVNNPLNSITKESTLEFIKDINIGLGVTGAVSNSVGLTTIFTKSNHNLNSITGVDFSGTGYAASGITTTLYNVSLLTEQSGLTGQDATVNITVVSGNINALEIVDGGSAYGIGNTMRIGSGVGVATVTAINNAVGTALQVIGIGTTGSINTSGYNGLYKITGIPGGNSIRYETGTNPGIYTTSTGTAYVTDKISTISSIVGVANTTLAGIVTVTTDEPHGLFGGNKIKISGVTGTASTVFDSDFLVQEVVTRKKFTISADPGITTANSAVTSAEIYRYGIGAFGQDSSFSDEKISGSMIPLTVGISTTINSQIDNSVNQLTLTSSVGFSVGDFLQIESEIVRITNITGNQLTFLRGVLGTKPSAHKSNNVLKVVKPVPSELRRFSSIRASGHTFEYVGYGPGNYSTALPQKRNKTLTNEEELLALSKEEKGGMVFFSGMNDRGDFFSGQRIEPRENFLGEDDSDLTAVFDDVYIRNTLTVGGGPNRLLPSEFRGPVNFTNKITSTSPDGILAIKLILKGTINQNPFFQVGGDSSPSLVVNESTQNVGIKTADPKFDLDVNGTIRANAYESFELEDLPIGVDEEVTFARNRVLKVKNDASGYELVDVHELESYGLQSYGISNDPTVYVGIGTTANVGSTNLPKTAITGINTEKFYVGEKVKIFGASESDGLVSPPPDGQQIERVGTSDTVFTYRYWLSEYDLKTGKVGVSSQMEPLTGVGHTMIEDFNDVNLIKLTLKRSSTDNGLLVFRQDTFGSNPLKDITLAQNAVAGVSTIKLTDATGIQVGDQIIGIGSLSVHPATTSGPAGINTVDSISGNVITLESATAALINSGTTAKLVDSSTTADQSDAKLVAILGPKDLTTALNDIIWKDYGNYDQVSWTTKGLSNEYDSDQIHFPAIATTGHRKGWATDEVVEIGIGTIFVKNSYKFNNDLTAGAGVGFGTNSVVYVTHDNTFSLRTAIDKTVASGGNYLNLGSGTYLAEKVVIPAGFTITGNGKNSIIKQQYYSNSADDHAAPRFTGNIAPASANITNVSDLTNLTLGMSLNLDGGGGTVTAPTGITTITAINTSTKVITIDATFGGTGTATGAKFSAGNSLSFDGNFVVVSDSNAKDVTIKDCTIDGNSSNNILFDDSTTDKETANYLVNMNGVDSSLFKSSEIRNSPGSGLYVGNSNRMSIENSAFVDGSLTDRFSFQPLSASNAKVLRVNDSLFENYPGALDVSATEVVMTGGNIVRNCGTGIRIHASSKITTTNNVILGPSDEYIPSPDIYDSDFNSINLTVDTDEEFHTPFYQYIRNGSEYDLSHIPDEDDPATVLTTGGIIAGIGTIINEGASNESLGDKFLMFSRTNQESSTNGTQFGYLSFKLTAAQTSTLVGSATSALGYDIVATEFLDIPLGFTTSVNINSGAFNQTGAGATNYTITLNNRDEHVAFAVGDVVKLQNHESTPEVGVGTVSQKTVSATTATVKIDIQPTTTNSINGGETGYILIRNIFTIAKGRVGVI